MNANTTSVSGTRQIAGAASARQAETELEQSLSEAEMFIVETLERLDAADSKAAHLERALAHSRDIGAAIGILMASHKVTQQEAFDLLRHSSQDLNRKLHTLAQDVIDTGELPS